MNIHNRQLFSSLTSLSSTASGNLRCSPSEPAPNFTPCLSLTPILLLSSEFCQCRPESEFFIAPTTPRKTPFWFSTAQPAISKSFLLKFSTIRLAPCPYLASYPHLQTLIRMASIFYPPPEVITACT